MKPLEYRKSDSWRKKSASLQSTLDLVWLYQGIREEKEQIDDLRHRLLASVISLGGSSSTIIIFIRVIIRID
ncbi:hypothetical protein Leryth_008966 [Lithospermum erythrorhizon]|nr:hypothetical protein Leryth_008966 [Lithospermum erythrorhizon]